MKPVRDDGEPISRGRVNRRKAGAEARRDAVVALSLYMLIVFVGVILAILFIALAQAAGWWEVESAAQSPTRIGMGGSRASTVA